MQSFRKGKCNNAFEINKKIGSKDVEVATIATSGTIRSLVKKHMANFIDST